MSCGVHEVLCSAVEVCWAAYPVDLICSVAEERDMSFHGEISISFRANDPELTDDVQLYDLARSATMSLADYRSFIRAFVPAALALGPFGLSEFERQVPKHIQHRYELD